MRILSWLYITPETGQLSAEVSRLYRVKLRLGMVYSELMQQDGRTKKTANLVWQE